MCYKTKEQKIYTNATSSEHSSDLETVIYSKWYDFQSAHVIVSLW